MTTAQSELANGAAFAEVAERFSDCPANAGDLGWFPAANGGGIRQQVFSLAGGQTSGYSKPARLPHRPPHRAPRRRHPPLSVVRESISARLYEQRKQQALNQYLESLIAKNESLLRSSKSRAALLEASRQASAEKPRVTSGSTSGMIRLDGDRSSWAPIQQGSQPTAKAPFAK